MADPFEEEHGCLQICLMITFSVSLFSPCFLGFAFLSRYIYEKLGIWFWLILGNLLIYIVLQIYTIIKYGFRNGFSFLKLVISGRGRGGM
jgi:hypothetical protein